jgi:hypothetical protein
MLYEFTPDTMEIWSLSPAVHYRADTLLLTKTIVLSRSAQSGIFAIQNSSLKGFQQANLTEPSEGCIFSLYSDLDRMEFILSEKNYKGRVSQAEVNRIVQSLHRITSASSTGPSTAKND